MQFGPDILAGFSADWHALKHNNWEQSKMCPWPNLPCYFSDWDCRLTSAPSTAILAKHRMSMPKSKIGQESFMTYLVVSHLPWLKHVCGCRLVHDDVFQVMKYSFEESLTADVAQRCVDFWYAFVDPFFGLPPRPKEAAVKVTAPLLYCTYLADCMDLDCFTLTIALYCHCLLKLVVG